MSITRNSLKRPAALFAAAALLVGAAAPLALKSPSAEAAQVSLTSRSIQMSDSAPSATAVKYKLTMQTTQAMQSFVVDFCGDSPLIGLTCTAPTGFATGSATLTANGTWSIVATASQWKFTNTASQAAGSFTLEVNGITNPSTTGTFYARVLTYSNAGYGTYVSASSPGNYNDYGGIALSTTTPISITAKVQETMTLCTSGGTAATMPTPTAGFTGLNCAGFTAPAITLGGGTNYDVIDSSSIYRRSAWSQISTNATNGYAIYMRANNLCGGGLTKAPATDATCGIPAVNGGASSALAIIAGTAAFGVDVEDGVAESGGVGDNQAVAPWSTNSNNPTNQFVMDDTTSNNSVKTTNSPYGSKVIDTTAATVKQANSVTNEYKFGVTASPTTPSGIYQQQFSLIAVGLF
jgi:hypothetical protein